VMSSSEHTAAILRGRGKFFEVTKRPTPTPGLYEVLIEAKAVAINPIDHIQQSKGFRIARYPAVLGSDVAGVVSAIGDGVLDFKIGDRVTAFAPAFFMKGSPNYGAFQEKVVIPEQYVTSIPISISYNEAAMLPLAVSTSWHAFLNLGIRRDVVYRMSDKKAILIWSVASSVGSAALQIAKSLGFYVYATASATHHAYLQQLGNGPGIVKLFDYHDPELITKISKEAEEDGVFIELAILANGSLKDCMKVIAKAKGRSETIAMIASIPWSMKLLWWKIKPVWGKAAVIFVEPKGNEAEKKESYEFIFNTWLKLKLADGGIVPSPRPFVIRGGIASIQQGVESWKKGVSGVKIIIEI
jgi:NADPH:quinone reductase-like Zn-dependent oxidoreductase